MCFFEVVFRTFGQSPCPSAPYDHDRLVRMVKSQPAELAAKLIAVCGIKVSLTTALEGELDGAPSILLAAIRAYAPKAAEIRVNSIDQLSYAYIPPGTFQMGCGATDGCTPLQPPNAWAQMRYIRQARSELKDGFWLGTTEVTIAAFRRFAAAEHRQAIPNALKTQPEWIKPQHPIISITWYEARDYCRWAGGSLPTEQQWEYAARGGTQGRLYLDLTSIAWFIKNSGTKVIDFDQLAAQGKTHEELTRVFVDNKNGPHDVGQLKPNKYGLYDMIGNASEWINGDVSHPNLSQYKIVRGGSFQSSEDDLGAAIRREAEPTDRGDVGFRCVVEYLRR
jgi:formylglycine-generating enzyme required for sulfatase activity